MKKDLADTLRDAIRKSGLSANQLAKATDIDQTTISRFLRGKDMSLHRASKIAAHLGLELRETKRPRK